MLMKRGSRVVERMTRMDLVGSQPPLLPQHRETCITEVAIPRWVLFRLLDTVV
jgi:hypothetical protein